jgi:LmeA-like phospholipid-binding
MRRLLIGVLVLVALLLAVDRGAEFLAGRAAADRLADRPEVVGQPDVNVGGFPFLTQLLAREFDDVDVSVPALTAQGVPLTDVDLQLRGVTPASGFTSVQVAQVDGTAVLTYADLQAASPVTGITFSDGGNGTVAFAGSVTALGRQLDITGTAALRAEGTTVTVDPQQISTGDERLDAAAEQLLTGALVFDVGGLPANLALTGARGGPDGVVVTASGSNLTLP